MAVPRAARMGNTISAVAVFEVSSVRNVIKKQILPINIPGESDSRPDICSPNQTERPDSINPPANANPPPNSKTIFHGRREAVLQSRIRELFLSGIINNTSAKAIAMVPSLM